MPVKPNFLERMLFYNLNLAPAPLLDMAGALAYQTVSTAARLNLFPALQEKSLTPAELANELNTDERGTRALLSALAAIGYVQEREGRYANTASTAKWLMNEKTFDIDAVVEYWDAILTEIWPSAADAIRTGNRPVNFYDWVEARPSLSRAFQRMMITSANLAGPDVAKKLDMPASASRVLDVAGGHGMFSIVLCQKYPGLHATILDSQSALETAGRNVEEHQMADRIQLQEGDLWQEEWGQNYDVILLFNLLHHFDIEINRRLLEKANNALKVGGKLAILEQLEGKVMGTAAEGFIQLIALQYYLAVDGRIYSREEIAGLIKRTDFADIRFHNFTKSPGTSLVTATKRGNRK
jgi:2-polyprenyl-3-methyl-5-hydroxy-6-metoxy-1,4-benzoquinol methylase